MGERNIITEEKKSDVQDAGDVQNTQDAQNVQDVPYNRRNVNRIKRAILITAALFMIIPTCLSIYLFVRVSKLQKELDDCRDELEKKEIVTESENRSEEEESSEEALERLD